MSSNRWMRTGRRSLYSRPSSSRSVMYLTMTSRVTCGMSLSGPIFASCTATRLRPLVVVYQRKQRGLALPLGQRPQRGVEALQPGRVVADPLDREPGFDEPVDVLVEPDAVVVRVHHV